MNESETRVFCGMWCPAEVVELVDSGGISIKEAWLLMTINTLSKTARGCFAGDGFLGEKIQVDERQASRIIHRLVKLGLIIRHGKQRSRSLCTPWSRKDVQSLSTFESDKSVQLSRTEMSDRVGQKCPQSRSSIEREEERTTSPDANDASGRSKASHAMFVRFWDRKYTARFGKYPWAKKDFGQITIICKALQQDQIRIRQTITNYLANTDKYFTGHPIAKLMNQLPAFIPTTKNLRTGEKKYAW